MPFAAALCEASREVDRFHISVDGCDTAPLRSQALRFDRREAVSDIHTGSLTCPVLKSAKEISASDHAPHPEDTCAFP